MSDYLDVTICIEETQQRFKAQVDSRITVHELIMQLYKKDLVKANTGHLSLYELQLELQQRSKPLDKERTLWQNNVQDGATLVLKKNTQQDDWLNTYIAAGKRYPFGSHALVTLEELRTREVFRLDWQPAIIGRKNTEDPSKNILLAVDLTRFDPNRQISRHQACITRKNNIYYLNPLSRTMPTLLNDKKLGVGRHELRVGDKIQVGNVVLTFHLIRS